MQSIGCSVEFKIQRNVANTTYRNHLKLSPVEIYLFRFSNPQSWSCKRWFAFVRILLLKNVIAFYFYLISLASISLSHAKESIFIEEADKVSKLLLLRQLCFDSNRGHERNWALRDVRSCAILRSAFVIGVQIDVTEPNARKVKRYRCLLNWLTFSVKDIRQKSTSKHILNLLYVQLQNTQPLLFPFVDAFYRTSEKKQWTLLLFNYMLISAKYSAV